METTYQYFNRELSWLAFNERVLLEADRKDIPVSERIRFMSIFSNNLEEFYKVRIANVKRQIAIGETQEDTDTTDSSQLLEAITAEVKRQLDLRRHIYTDNIIPALEQANIHIYSSPTVEQEHQQFIKQFFQDEVFPFLQPVPVSRGGINTFLREGRLYLAILLHREETVSRTPIFTMRIPFSKTPRFIELPTIGDRRFFMFLEDLIIANLDYVFSGYRIEEARCIKTSRDADIFIDDTTGDIVEKVKKNINKRKIGAVCRFVYDREMSPPLLSALMDNFHIAAADLIESDRHLNLEDLQTLLPAIEPHPAKRSPITINYPSLLSRIRCQDMLLYYPYHSFTPVLQWLNELIQTPDITQIFITQYRVAEHSAVINALIAAANSGKQVTVFVELKARFDEANNLATAELMQRAGIHIIYSIPKMKVHAKVALAISQSGGYAYVSTGNFNEATASVYADMALFTAHKDIVHDLTQLFGYLSSRGQSAENIQFRKMLVPPFNLVSTLTQLINREIAIAKQGGEARIILKMNALQEHGMIDLLYAASLSGVQIDLIVRGICCLVPQQPYSSNIRITRIVSNYLEHARVWYFHNAGNDEVYLGSADFMQRNLYRRIEAVVPILDSNLRRNIIHLLHLQLANDPRSCFVNERGQNVFKNPTEGDVGDIQSNIQRYLNTL